MDTNWKEYKEQGADISLCFWLLCTTATLFINGISYLQMELVNSAILGLLYLSCLGLICFCAVIVLKMTGKRKKVISFLEPFLRTETEVVYLVGSVSLIGSIFTVTIGEYWVRDILFLTVFQNIFLTEIVVFILVFPFLTLFFACIFLIIRKMITNTHQEDSVLVVFLFENCKIWEKKAKWLERFPMEKRCMKGAIFGNMIQNIIGFAALFTIWNLVPYDGEKLLGIAILFIVISFMNMVFIIESSNYEEMSVLLDQIEQIADGTIIKEPCLEEQESLYMASVQLSQISVGMGKSNEKQRKSEKMKVDLITNVSHDLKTPLTSMIGYMDLLKKEPLSEVEKDYVDAMSIKADKLKEMVQNLFELSKATSGAVEMLTERLDLKKLLEQTMGDMSDQIDSSNKNLKMILPENEVLIFADGKMLYRVYQNLIENAIKYSMDGTRIFIELDKLDDYAVVTIKNVASYVMEFTAEGIVERFQRGDESRTTEGNGLGLAIAKSFTENCGGEFEVVIDGDLFKVITKFPII